MTCAKCRQAPPFEGDTWCVTCSAWESLGISLANRWSSAGLRSAACEAVVGAARLVKSLRQLDAGLCAQAKSEAVRPKNNPVVKKEPERSPRSSRSPLRRSSHRRSEVDKRPREASPSFEEEEGEEEASLSEESEKDRPRSPSRLSRPPEPAGPPPSKVREEVEERREEDRDRRPQREHHSHRASGRKQKKRRAGRKHKRLHRLVSNPHTPVHRALPPEFWQQSLERRSHHSQNWLNGVPP